MVSQAYRDLLDGGIWASSSAAEKTTPESEGIDRADGWDVTYEQRGSGNVPRRTLFNQRDHEIDSALFDIAASGIPPWDAEVNYTPTADAACFATTENGLFVTFVNTGPAYGNATNPDDEAQQVWRIY